MNKGELFLQLNDLSANYEKLKMTIHAVIDCKKESAQNLAMADAENHCNDLIQNILGIMTELNKIN